MDRLNPLSPDVIMAAYQSGYFPMPDAETSEILWYNPDPRAIIPLDGFHLSQSLKRTIRRQKFTVTINQDFESVITGCANRDPTWISSEIKSAYINLHKLGYCHSIEVRNKDQSLVGGVYGLSQGAVFNAESMFSLESDASKVALWALVSRMKELGLKLLEVQFMTEHLRSLGAIEVSKTDYLRQLSQCLAINVRFLGHSGPYNIL